MSELTLDRTVVDDGDRPDRRPPRRRLPWGRMAAAVVSLGLAGAAATIVGNTQGEPSPFTQVSQDLAVPGDDAPADPAGANPFDAIPGAIRVGADGATFGPASGPHTLVLYDASSPPGAKAELNATQAAQLATHFGPVTVQDVARYEPASLRRYAAVLYLGTHDAAALSPQFLRDVTTADTPVIWAGANVEELATASAGGPAAFRTRYGWDPQRRDTLIRPSGVRYKDQVLARDNTLNLEEVVVPADVDARRTQVLAESTCGTVDHPTACRPGAVSPWAIRSANLTYVAEVPFSYVSGNDRMLAYADLLYPALAPDRSDVRRAAVRLEDVSPMSDPATIREYADYLHSEGVPFSIAVIPRYIDPLGVYHGGDPTSVRLEDTPKVVEALQYAVERGATLVQHGTTHQFQATHNPYTGVTGEDYEFVNAGCSEVGAADGDFVPCRPDTVVRQAGTLGNDSVAGWQARVEHGQQLFTAAGLPTPTIFETPHYAASTRAYAAMRNSYGVRYERMELSDGMLTGRPASGPSLGVFFPYSTTDVTGARIVPENLGNYAPVRYSGHPTRDVAGLIANARANLVVRESTASFFFHPFLPRQELERIVDGIKALGYTFVAPTDLL